MKNVTKDQIEAARRVDLLTYLRLHEPNELVQKSANEYRTKSHSSLVISNGKWYYNRGQFGGVSALDYLMRVRGADFVTAVETVSEYSQSITIPQETARPPPKRAFVLPPTIKYPAKLTAYLQKRGISPAVIGECISAGLIYESVHRNEPVCVFVGRDEQNKPRYATMRGISSDLKRDAVGSDKRFGFLLPASNPDSTTLAVFESAIDTLSAKVMGKSDAYRLSLGGTAPPALFEFLQSRPNIRHISLCLDADAAGQEAAKKIQSQLAVDGRFSHIRAVINPPVGAKDYNAMLMNKLAIEREQKIIKRRERC